MAYACGSPGQVVGTAAPFASHAAPTCFLPHATPPHISHGHRWDVATSARTPSLAQDTPPLHHAIYPTHAHTHHTPAPRYTHTCTTHYPPHTYFMPHRLTWARRSGSLLLPASSDAPHTFSHPSHLCCLHTACTCLPFTCNCSYPSGTSWRRRKAGKRRRKVLRTCAALQPYRTPPLFEQRHSPAGMGASWEEDGAGISRPPSYRPLLQLSWREEMALHSGRKEPAYL